MPEMVRILRRCGDGSLSAEIEAKLCQMSAATMDRSLGAWKLRGGRHPLSTTRPGSVLRSAIPIRTFADWQEHKPGFIEVTWWRIVGRAPMVSIFIPWWPWM
jgi:hypothetical protein